MRVIRHWLSKKATIFYSLERTYRLLTLFRGHLAKKKTEEEKKKDFAERVAAKTYNPKKHNHVLLL